MKREILVFIIGTTPQIITETIYALSQKDPPVYANEIYIITTSVGKKRIKETLLNKNILKQLFAEYKIPPVEINENSFIIVKDSNNIEIEDIRDRTENERMGDLITSFIREKTLDTESRLHCSLAGGRKTMSFYLGSALQFFGRAWDKLYHVLVTSEFESNPEFYYKPKKNTVIETRLPDGTYRKLNTKDADIHLAELPLIRLRSKLYLHSKSFKELVEEGQKEIDIALIQPEVRLKLSERVIYIGDKVIEMIPIQMMIYSSFLRQKKEQCKYPERLNCLDCTDCFPVLSDLSSIHALNKMAEDYKRMYMNNHFKEKELMDRWKEGMDIGALRYNISKINKTIREQVDGTLLPYYEITTVKRYASSRYGIKIERCKIRIE